MSREEYNRLDELPPFEAFTWNHATIPAAGAHQIADKMNAEGYAYYNFLSHGEKDWASEWFDFLNKNVLPVMDEHFVPARFPWGNRTLLDWYALGYTSTVLQLVDVAIVEHFGIFADHAWKRPYDWMFGPNGPPRSQCLPANADAVWRWSISYALREIERKVPLIVNGDADDFGVRHFEHAQNNLPLILDLWQRQPGSICSVDANAAPWAVEKLLDKWLAVGGWISFTTMDPAGQPDVDAAFEEAAKRRG